MSNLGINYLIYLIIVVVFFAGMLAWVTMFQDGAATKEDFYAKQLAKLINSADPYEETTITLDVSEAVKLANSNKKKRSDIFTFDNVNNLVTVSLRQGQGTSYPFFNDVDIIVDEDIIKLEPVGEGIETLNFKIVKTARGENE